MAVIANHNGDGYANTYSNARNSYYGITGYPTVKFDGIITVVGGSSSSSMYSSYVPKVNQRNAIACDYTIAIYGTASGMDYDILLRLDQVFGSSVPNLVAHLVITESGLDILPGSSSSWNSMCTEVNNVTREMLPNQNGTAVTFTGQGDRIDLNLSFTRSASWNLGQLELVAFIQDNTTKEILQGAKVPLFILPPPPPPLGAEFTVDDNTVAPGMGAQFIDESAGDPTSWLWEFEGGTPPTSDLEVPPPVTYDAVGKYSVKLTVSDGIDTNIMEKPGFMDIGLAPIAEFSANQTAIVVGGTVDFTDLSIDNPDAWSWEFEGGTPDVSQDQNPTGIQYNGLGTFNVTLTSSNDYGEFTLTKEGYLYVGGVGIDEMYAVKGMAVSPVPNNGHFNFYYNGNGNINIKIYNTAQSLIFSQENIQVNGKYQSKIDISQQPNGVYFVVVEGTQDREMKKVVVQH